MKRFTLILCGAICSLTMYANSVSAKETRLQKTEHAELNASVNPNSLYQAKQYEAAYLLWRKQAQKGDGFAQYAIGMMLLNGQGVKPNKAEGLRWLTMAANKNQQEAMRQLMNLYSDGLQVTKNQAEAVKWAKKLDQEWNDEEASKFLAIALSDSNNIDELNESIERFKSFITEDKVDYFEQYRLGMAYANRAKYFPEDVATARKWFEISEKNSPLGFERYPYLGRKAFLPDNEQADLSEYERNLVLANQGDAKAQFEVYQYLFYDKKDLPSAFEWLTKSANQNYAEALYRMGEKHSSAFNCLKNIHMDKDPNAEIKVGVTGPDGQPLDTWTAEEMQCTHGGLSKDVMNLSLSELTEQSKTKAKIALDFYKKAAAQNHPEALYKVYEEDESLSPEQAFAYLLKAGELGQTEALSALGDAYLEGKIVPKDLAKALDWYQKSAEYGIEAAVGVKVAQFYCKGMGVPQDMDRCRYYLQKGYDSVGEDIDLYATELGLMPYVKKLISPSHKKHSN